MPLDRKSLSLSLSVLSNLFRVLLYIFGSSHIYFRISEYLYPSICSLFSPFFFFGYLSSIYLLVPPFLGRASQREAKKK